MFWQPKTVIKHLIFINSLFLYIQPVTNATPVWLQSTNALCLDRRGYRAWSKHDWRHGNLPTAQVASSIKQLVSFSSIWTSVGQYLVSTTDDRRGMQSTVAYDHHFGASDSEWTCPTTNINPSMICQKTTQVCNVETLMHIDTKTTQVTPKNPFTHETITMMHNKAKKNTSQTQETLTQITWI